MDDYGIVKFDAFLDQSKEVSLVKSDSSKRYYVHYRGDCPIISDGIVKLISYDDESLTVQCDSNLSQFFIDLQVELGKKINKVYNKIYKKKSIADILSYTAPLINDENLLQIPSSRLIFTKDGNHIKDIKKKNFAKSFANHFNNGDIFACTFSIDTVTIKPEDVTINISFIHLKPVENETVGEFEEISGEDVESVDGSESGSEDDSDSDSDSDSESEESDSESGSDTDTETSSEDLDSSSDSGSDFESDTEN